MVYRGLGRATSLSAAALAATIILAFLAGCSSGGRNAASQHGVAATVISPHLPFGNPSDAGGDPDNRLALRQQFAASWNSSKRTANWVAWRLVAMPMLACAGAPMQSQRDREGREGAVSARKPDIYNHAPLNAFIARIRRRGRAGMKK